MPFQQSLGCLGRHQHPQGPNRRIGNIQRERKRGRVALRERQRRALLLGSPGGHAAHHGFHHAVRAAAQRAHGRVAVAAGRHARASAASELRLVHRLVGGGQQLPGVGAVLRCDGDADGDPNARGRPLNRRVRVCQHLVQPLRHRPGGLQVAMLHDHDELIAADASHEIFRPAGVAELARQHLEHPVSDLVTERVVEELQVVHVDHEHGAAAALFQARPQLLQPFVEVAQVREPGELVMARVVLRLLVEAQPVDGHPQQSRHFFQRRELLDGVALDVEMGEGEHRGAHAPGGDRDHRHLLHVRPERRPVEVRMARVGAGERHRAAALDRRGSERASERRGLGVRRVLLGVGGVRVDGTLRFVDEHDHRTVERDQPAHLLGEGVERLAQVDHRGDERREVAHHLDARGPLCRLAVERGAVEGQGELFGRLPYQRSVVVCQRLDGGQHHHAKDLPLRPQRHDQRVLVVRTDERRRGRFPRRPPGEGAPVEPGMRAIDGIERRGRERAAAPPEALHVRQLARIVQARDVEVPVVDELMDRAGEAAVQPLRVDGRPHGGRNCGQACEFVDAARL